MSKISELSDGGVIQGGDTLIAVRSGGNVKVTYGGTTTANIDGGTIDNTVIGGTTPAAGNFTTVTADGLTVDGNSTTGAVKIQSGDTNTFGGGRAQIAFGYNATDDYQHFIRTAHDVTAAGNKLELLLSDGTQNNTITSGSNRVISFAGNGDISFYESTGTTPKFHWDASAESLGIGTSSPSSALHVSDAVTHAASTEVALIQNTTTGQPVALAFQAVADNGGSGNEGAIYFDAGADGTTANNQLQFTADHQSDTTPDMVITGAGNVGIGTDSPQATIQTKNTSNSATLASVSNSFSISHQSGSYTEGHYYGVLGFAKANSNGATIGAAIAPVMVGDGNTRGLAFGIASGGGSVTEKFRLDDSGNLLVGKTSVDTSTPGTVLRGAVSSIFVVDGSVDNQVAIFNRTTNDGKILDFHKDGTTVGSVGTWNQSGSSRISMTNPNGNGFGIFRDSSTVAQIVPMSTSGNGDDTHSLGRSDYRWKDLWLSGTAYSDTLLVGKTSPTSATDGAELKNGNGVSAIIGTSDQSNAASGNVMILNRRTTDGTIVDFRKDGTTVGSIFSHSSGNMGIGTGATGVLFAATSNSIQPWNPSSNAARDATQDLGTSGNRFKDLYLSGGVHLGGTAAANKLDDYEEGTWTPVPSGSTTTGSYTDSLRVGKYTKIGNRVFFDCVIYVTNFTGTGDFRITGLPFAITTNNNTVVTTVQANNAPWTLGADEQHVVAYGVAGQSYLEFRTTNRTGSIGYTKPQCTHSTVGYLRVTGQYEV